MSYLFNSFVGVDDLPRIYLDNAAATPPTPQSLEIYNRYNNWVNPNAIYYPAVAISKQIERAREQCAKAINAFSPKQIIFTSCASESNSLVIGSYATVISSAYEHKSILSHPNVSSNTVTDVQCLNDFLEDMSGLLYKANALVTFMMVQNETGEIFPIKKIAETVHKYGLDFHTDASQAFGKIAIDVQRLDVDYMTISSQKINAPRGCSVLYAKDPSKLTPLIYGTQEMRLRGGTQNVGAIIAMGYAMQDSVNNLTETVDLYCTLRYEFLRQLTQCFSDELSLPCITTQRNVPYLIGYTDKLAGNPCVPNIILLAFRDKDAETIVLSASTRGLCISAGSACDSKVKKIGVSPAVKRLNFPKEYENGAVRISFSRVTDITDCVRGAEILAKTIKGM